MLGKIIILTTGPRPHINGHKLDILDLKLNINGIQKSKNDIETTSMMVNPVKTFYMYLVFPLHQENMSVK